MNRKSTSILCYPVNKKVWLIKKNTSIWVLHSPNTIILFIYINLHVFARFWLKNEAKTSIILPYSQIMDNLKMLNMHLILWGVLLLFFKNAPSNALKEVFWGGSFRAHFRGHKPPTKMSTYQSFVRFTTVYTFRWASNCERSWMPSTTSLVQLPFLVPLL